MATDTADAAAVVEAEEECDCGETTSDGGCKIVQLPALKELSGAMLRAQDGRTIKAKQLWADNAALIFGVRRPGCVLCRYQAQQLWSAREELEAGGVKLIVVVHEWVDTEIAAFTEAAYYWGGDVYLDVDKAFYKAFGNGKLNKGSLMGALNPFNPVWKRIKEANKHVKDSNLKGEATVMGGLLVVRPGKGGVAWMHAEKNFGEFPDTSLVVAEALKAAGKQA